MTSETSRGKDVGRTLRMLAALMHGDRLDAKTAAERFEINKEGALRNLKLLAEHVPGVDRDDEGPRHVFFFLPVGGRATGLIAKDPGDVGECHRRQLGCSVSGLRRHALPD